jgi:thioredoxin 1
MVAPIIDQVADLTDGKAKVVKLNVDENPRVAGAFGITGIPTVIVFREGRVAYQLVGAQPAQVYLNALAG